MKIRLSFIFIFILITFILLVFFKSLFEDKSYVPKKINNKIENIAIKEFHSDNNLQLKNQYNYIHDVRGSGLFLGVELIDTDCKPNSNLAGLIKNQLRESNILIGTDGKHNNVLKTKPPLCFSKKNVDEVIQRIDTK